VAKSISHQLLDAFLAMKDAKKLTLEELLARCQRKKMKDGTPVLDCDFTSLSRKLHGKQGMTVSEALVIAEALDIELDFAVDTKVKAS
jgi:hypothetical protein